jgi:hypothetical protein
LIVDGAVGALLPEDIAEACEEFSDADSALIGVGEVTEFVSGDALGGPSTLTITQPLPDVGTTGVWDSEGRSGTGGGGVISPTTPTSLCLLTGSPGRSSGLRATLS